MSEKGSPSNYSWEELLSFDRLRRAISRRVFDKVETLPDDEFPLKTERISEIVAEEWRRAKAAVRSSPAAREMARKHLEQTVQDHIDKLLQADKTELQALGITEKGL